MKCLIAACIFSLLAPTVVVAADAKLETGSVHMPLSKTIYSITTQLVKDGELISRTGFTTMAHSMGVLDQWETTPIIVGVMRTSSSPDTPQIKRDLLKTGIFQTISCFDNNAPGADEILCSVKGEIRYNARPEETTPKAQKALELEIEQGKDVITMVEVQSHSWDQLLAVHPGEKATLTMGKYQYEITVQRLQDKNT